MSQGDVITIKKLTVAEKAKVDRLEVDKEILPRDDDTVDLGSSTKEIKDAYVDGVGYLDGLEVQTQRGIRFSATTSATWDPPSVANGAQTSTNVTVAGAALGDSVVVSFSLSLSGLALFAYVSAADTVTVVLSNATGAAVDLGSGTLRIQVVRMS